MQWTTIAWGLQRNNHSAGSLLTASNTTIHHSIYDLGVGDEGYGTLAGADAPSDSDRDGMPDEWETKRGLDPSDASDRNGDDDADGYTNLEAYLNELTAPAFPH